MNTIFFKRPFAPKEKTPSFGIPINARWPVITLDALPLLINSPLVLCKSTRSHFHHFTPSHLPPPEKTPKAMADKGKTPCEENSPPPKKRTIRE
jgi:hypothetical protein